MWRAAVCLAVPVDEDEFFYPRTDFQLQWEAMGKPIYRARFIKLQKV